MGTRRANKAKAITSNTRLLRTEGLLDGKPVNVFDILGSGLRRSSKTQRTREFEAKVNLGDALYLYVGWCTPEFGTCAFAVNPERIRERWTTTPFDSGGIDSKLEPVQSWSLDAKRAFLKRERATGETFAERFAAFLCDHFEAPMNYFQDIRPNTAGMCPHEIDLERNRDRRAWTWEAQIDADLPFEFDAWSVPRDVELAWRRACVRKRRDLPSGLLRTPEMQSSVATLMAWQGREVA